MLKMMRLKKLKPQMKRLIDFKRLKRVKSSNKNKENLLLPSKVVLYNLILEKLRRVKRN